MVKIAKLVSDLDNTEIYYAELGLSYDSVFAETRSPILIGNPIKSSAAPSDIKDSFFYEFSSTQDDFSKTTKVSASGKASFGFGKAKASGSRKKFFSSNSYSCYIFAQMRIVHPDVHFDLRKVNLEPYFETLLKNNHESNIDRVERKVGDEVITSVSLCSEILVKLEIRTSSEQQREEVKASVSASGSGGSGSGSFSSIVSKIKSSKKITISLYGDIPGRPGGFLEDITPEELDKFLLRFPTESTNNFSILEYHSEPLANIPQLLIYEDIVNRDELRARKLFVGTANALYEDLLDWKEDILYVTSASNKNEFTLDIINEANNDLIICDKWLKKLDNLIDEARVYWVNNGSNGNKFDLTLLSETPVEFPVYSRIEPIVITTTPPPPKKKERREPAEIQGHGADARGGTK